MTLRQRACLVLGLLVPTSAPADTLVGTPGFAWQPWTTSQVNQNNTPFWDGNSSDSALPFNIGNCLAGTGACAGLIPDPPGTIPYWGSATGAADPNFYFERSSPLGNHAALRVEFAGLAATNVFGWYDIANPSVLYPLFSGSDTTGSSAFFTPTPLYGFYLQAPGVNRIWFTQSSLNRRNTSGASANTGQQHFAVFGAPPDAPYLYWIGMEDLRLGSSDRDYNDMIVRVSVVTPEPASWLLVGAGLVLATWVRRRSSLGLSPERKPVPNRGKP